jgi:hypothetical protein
MWKEEGVESLRRPAAAGIAANVATVAFALAIALQILLALGVVPITMAWGGTQPVLTLPLRLASLAAALILAASAYVIRRRAGLSGRERPGRAVQILAWLITAYLLLNTLGNLASSSSGERLLFAPVSLALVVSCLVVCVSPAST